MATQGGRGWKRASRIREELGSKMGHRKRLDGGESCENFQRGESERVRGQSTDQEGEKG